MIDKSESRSSSTKSSSAKTRYALKQPRAFALALVLLVILGFIWWKQHQPTTPTPQPEPTPLAQQDLVESEVDYIAQMIPHTLEAIESARYMAENSPSERMRDYAEEVINLQTKQMWTLRSFYQLVNEKEFIGADQYQNKMVDLKQFPPEQLDKEYLRALMNHYSQAVQMTDAIKRQSTKTEMQAIANQVAGELSAEIVKLQAWYREFPQ